MDYVEMIVLLVVSLFVTFVMGFVLYDVGRDVLKAAQNEKKRQSALKKRNNVVSFSRETSRKRRMRK